MGLLDFLFGGSSISDDSSDDENKFSYGDTVMVRYNGKVGVIIAKEGNYYTVKLKDENEEEYYESYSGNELDRY